MSIELYLPNDVIHCILARLSVKEIMQLKCLSRFFRSIIDSSEFIEFHMSYSFHSKSQKLICANWKPDASTLVSAPAILRIPYIFNDQVIRGSLEHLYRPGQYDQKMNVVGTSRGLLCMHYSRRGVVYLYNPWIRDAKRLPKCPLKSLTRDRKWIYTLYGFGYDKVNDDFKVVKLCGVRNKTSPEQFKNESKVYGLKFNKWRSIEDIPYPIMKSRSGFFFGHSLHWLLLNHRDSFLAIDIRTGKHELLPLPDDLTNQDSDYLRILFGEFNGSFCISRCVSDGFEIWVMKDYGVNYSWTKHKARIVLREGLSIHPDCRLMWYSKNENEEQLIFTTRVGTPVFFDVQEQRLTRYPYIRARQFFFSRESLVPVSRGGGRRKRKRT